MPTESDNLVKQIKSSQKRLKIAQRDLQRPRGQFIGGPMDDITPWTGDAIRVKTEKDEIAKLTTELGVQVLRERA